MKPDAVRRPARIAGLAAVLAVALSGCGSPPPRISAQCRHDIARWNAFVGRETAAGWPNVPITDLGRILRSARHDLRIVRKDCPPDVKLRRLPQLAEVRGVTRGGVPPCPAP